MNAPRHDGGSPPGTASPLDEIVRESQTDLVPPPIGWSRVEAALLAKIASERPRATSRTRTNLRYVAAFVFAAAAAFAIVARRDAEPAIVAATSPDPQAAGSLRSTEGAGEVRVGGIAATAGHMLRSGDVLEADGARGVFERARKVVWLLEPDRGSVARARVKASGEALVVGLESGAIEAQVTPVPSGEAFAVDVATETKVLRVAVHGTHLRVTRDGSRMLVDLTEGAVAIGIPPRTGSTLGHLVTAPAHVEVDVNDPEGTLRVDHDAGLRQPVALGGNHDPAVHAEPTPSAALEKPGFVVAATNVVATRAASSAPPQTTADTAPATTTKPALSAAANRETLAVSVRACAASHHPETDVRVTVTSTLRLRVDETGGVSSAQFDPPLSPEIQRCAAEAIYRAKLLGERNEIAIPIEFSY